MTTPHKKNVILSSESFHSNFLYIFSDLIGNRMFHLKDFNKANDHIQIVESLCGMITSKDIFLSN